MQSKQTQANTNKAAQLGNVVFEREISLGKSENEAKFAAAQAIAQSKGGAVSLNKITDDGSLPSHGSSNPDTTSGFYLSNGTERGFFDYSASMNDVSEFLVGSPVNELAHGYAKNRLDAKVRRDQAFDAGVVSGIHNYNAGRAQRIANMSGFSADYMTAEQWQGIASNQYSKWNRELKNDVLDIVAAPLMLTGFGYAGMRLMGAGALKLSQGAFSLIHGSTRLAATRTMLYGGAQIGAGDFLIDRGINFAQKSLTGSNNVINDMHRVGKQIYHEAKRNGGLTIASGIAVSGDVGTRWALTPIGLWGSLDFNNMSFNGGFYGSGEIGSKLGLPSPSWSIGSETTIFTTSDYHNALSGKYTLQGASYNVSGKTYELAQIQAAQGNINGYQFTKELYGASVYSPKVNPSGFAHFGYGDYVTFGGIGNKLWR
ncbi:MULTISPECIES: hypothetical protein [unclassified Pseudoalteromonas]|uniref:hypothetical protein n=1 Tax=unclassified Pseudoalteromonas TaxID=194690 RepID=UPI00390CA030